MTIFPFLISYNDVSNYLLEITNNLGVSTECIVISYILINFINIWLIITLLKLILRTITKVIRTIFR